MHVLLQTAAMFIRLTLIQIFAIAGCLVHRRYVGYVRLSPCQSESVLRNRTGHKKQTSTFFDRGKSVTPLDWRLLRLHQAVEALPEPSRTIFRQHCLHGMPLEEIADMLAMTVRRVEHEFAFAMVEVSALDLTMPDDASPSDNS